MRREEIGRSSSSESLSSTLVRMELPLASALCLTAGFHVEPFLMACIKTRASSSSVSTSFSCAISS